MLTDAEAKSLPEIEEGMLLEFDTRSAALLAQGRGVAPVTVVVVAAADAADVP
jgi:hypothetical protein